MPKFSEAEMELIQTVGIELFHFLAKLYTTSKANGVDLDALFEKAAKENQLTIRDEI